MIWKLISNGHKWAISVEVYKVMQRSREWYRTRKSSLRTDGGWEEGDGAGMGDWLVVTGCWDGKAHLLHNSVYMRLLCIHYHTSDAALYQRIS